MKNAPIPSVVFLAVQVPIAWILSYAKEAGKSLWTQTLVDADLPFLTTVALNFGIVIPIIIAFITIVFFLLTINKKQSCLGWLLILGCIESLLLALLAYGLVKPALTISWGIY